MNIPYWLIAACIAVSLPAQAASTFKPVELKDNEMADLRGRFVMPGRIISFGIVMSSSWTSRNGDLVGASTSMQIQSNTVKPQFYVSTYSSAGNGAPVTQFQRPVAAFNWRFRPTIIKAVHCSK